MSAAGVRFRFGDVQASDNPASAYGHGLNGCSPSFPSCCNGAPDLPDYPGMRPPDTRYAGFIKWTMIGMLFMLHEGHLPSCMENLDNIGHPQPATSMPARLLHAHVVAPCDTIEEMSFHGSCICAFGLHVEWMTIALYAGQATELASLTCLVRGMEETAGKYGVHCGCLEHCVLIITP